MTKAGHLICWDLYTIIYYPYGQRDAGEYIFYLFTRER